MTRPDAGRAVAGRPGGTLPNFLVIGAMKSGTSSLAYHLGRHPDIFVSPKKELYFFNDRFDRGLDWYRSQFTEGAGSAVIGEATASYIYDRVALDRMAEIVPEARLLAILRDPVDRAYAHYWHEIGRNREHLPFAAAVAAEPERLATLPEGERRYLAYLDRGRYRDQLERVRTRFPRERLHVEIFEDLRDRPVEVFGRVAEFLGVDPSKLRGGVSQALNPYLEFRSRWLRDRTRRFPKPARDLVGRFNTVKASYPPMDPALRRELAAHFAEPNRALEAWLGRDLRDWTR